MVPTDDATDPTDVPWNGNLLLYAHGFVSALEPVALPPDGELLVSLFAPQGTPSPSRASPRTDGP